MSRAVTRLNPATMPNSLAIGYSQISIVEPGRMAYVSRQVAALGTGAPAPKDLAAQMRIVAANAKAALDALGAGPEDIVIARCFMTDLTPDRLAAALPPLLELFGGAAPCLTGVGVAALAGPDLQVEVELTVRLPD
jgi:enamine deaminase RidA (YjgF/YER057c/UK114 family)